MTGAPSLGRASLGTAPALGAAVVLAMVVLLAPPVRAEPPRTADAADGRGGGPGGGSLAALAVLQRAAQAPGTVSYRGTEIVVAWSGGATTTTLASVDHIAGTGTTVRVPATPGSPAREGYTPAGEGGSFDAVGIPGAGALALLSRTYDVRLGGLDAVAGRPATVVEAVRRDGGAVAARFWVDVGTGLLLRREVLDGGGRLVRTSAFLDVAVTGVRPPGAGGYGGGPDASDGSDDSDDASTWADALAGSQLADLRRHGWVCEDALPAGLTLFAASRLPRSSAGDEAVVHLGYTDGISAVSVFEQRGRVDRDRMTREGYRAAEVGGHDVLVAEGSPRRVMWDARGRVFTVLADAPDDTVATVVAALPHDAPDDGVVARLDRGLSRVASWFNPFG